jgi:hypothetical protein
VHGANQLALAGVEAIEAMGGPKVPWEAGRTDYETEEAATEHRGEIVNRCARLLSVMELKLAVADLIDYRTVRKAQTISGISLAEWGSRTRYVLISLCYFALLLHAPCPPQAVS